MTRPDRRLALRESRITAQRDRCCRHRPDGERQNQRPGAVHKQMLTEDDDTQQHRHHRLTDQHDRHGRLQRAGMKCRLLQDGNRDRKRANASAWNTYPPTAPSVPAHHDGWRTHDVTIAPDSSGFAASPWIARCRTTMPTAAQNAASSADPIAKACEATHSTVALYPDARGL